MATKKETHEKQKLSLYDNAEISDCLPSVRELDAVLRKMGFSFKEAGTSMGRDCIVNRVRYARGTDNLFLVINNAGGRA
jgi:hypothetical protein